MNHLAESLGPSPSLPWSTTYTQAHTHCIYSVCSSQQQASEQRARIDSLRIISSDLSVCVCRYIFQEKLKMYTRGQRQRGEAHTICSLLSPSWRSMLFVLLHEHPPVDRGNAGRSAALGSASTQLRWKKKKKAHRCSLQHGEATPRQLYAPPPAPCSQGRPELWSKVDVSCLFCTMMGKSGRVETQEVATKFCSKVSTFLDMMTLLSCGDVGGQQRMANLLQQL